MLARARRDRVEVRNAMRLLGFASSAAEAEAMVDRIDLSGDDRVNEDEFVHFMAKQLLDVRHLNAEMELAFDGMRIPGRRHPPRRPPPSQPRPLPAPSSSAHPSDPTASLRPHRSPRDALLGAPPLRDA